MPNVFNLESYRENRENPDTGEKNVNNVVVDLNLYRESRYKNKTDSISDFCLHKMCPRCSGTGVREDNQKICVHHISCKCQKCISFS